MPPDRTGRVKPDPLVASPLTEYHPGLRMLGDHGSTLYVVTKEA
jgi:hypothetical protein